MYLHFELTDGYEMKHKTWSSIEEVPYCFFKAIHLIPRSHGAKKLPVFHPNLAFPDRNSSLNWPMAMKWSTKPEVA